MNTYGKSLPTSKNPDVVQVFIGYDPVETVAWHVLAHSILARSSLPVSITPVNLRNIAHLFGREWDPKQSNEFSFSRFLVPYLCDYQGWAIFMDCDMLCLSDIAKLWALRDTDYTVSVVKNEHVVAPGQEAKYLGRPQTGYVRKNWSSMMLLNNAECVKLTPDYVSTAHGLDLHQFKWIEDDTKIGPLPRSWNHLVGVNEPNKDAQLVHYTLGGPWFNEFRDCEYASKWRKELEATLKCDQRS